MDNFFNHEVADWITKSMSRMDPDEAEMFGLFLVDEIYWADRENNARTINRHVEDIHKSLYRDVTDPVAKRLIEEVSKGKRDIIDPDLAYDKKWGKPQPRDKGGKFVKVSFPGFKFVKIEGQEGDPNIVYRHAVRGLDGRARTAEFDLSSALDTTGQETTAFQERWNTQTGSANERTYNRIATGGTLVRHIGQYSGNANIAAAGKVGEFVGDFGPEAEKVIGPAARKTAYRYRGTERTPSSDIDNLHDEMLARRLRGEGLSTKDITPELRMDTAEMAAIFYLGDRLPTKQLSELQLKSGKVPPSQGVMIDANGDVVVEAVGYNEDHYLPFNLKNLKNLKGGAYVRTRSTGGLTTEDIYTGLLAGARSVTVVSRSGVFTLDFDDELRGGRRYSDKAHQMVGQYGHILDAVKSEKVVREKLSPEERAEIRANVEDEMRGGDWTTKEIEDEIQSREKDFIAGVRYSESEVAEINRQAEEIADEYGVGIRTGSATQMRSAPKASGSGHRGVPQGPAFRDMPKDRDARVRAIKSELMDALREKKSKRKYVLDGEGYAAAMDALKEQYPYFIADVNYRPFREVNGQVRQPTNERDTGYVMPRYNRPAAAQAGYFAEEIEGKEKGKGKTPANEINYQNHINRQKTQAMTAVPISAEEAEEKTGKGSTRHSQTLEVRQAEARVRTQRQENELIQEGIKHGKALLANATSLKGKYNAVDEWDSERDDPKNLIAKDKEKLKKQLKDLLAQFDGLPDKGGWEDKMDDLRRVIRALDELDDQLASETLFKLSEWDVGRALRVPPKVENKEEYVEGAKAEVYKTAWAALNMRKDQERFEPDVSEGDLKNFVNRKGKLHVAAQELEKDDTDANRRAFMDAMIENEDSAGAKRVMRELVENEPDEDGKIRSDTLKKIAEKAKKEWERGLRLWRIKHVAGDKLTGSEGEELKLAAGAESESKKVDRALGTDNPRKAGNKYADDLLAQDLVKYADHHPNPDVKSVLRAMADSLVDDDDEAMRNQAKELKEMDKTYFAFIRKMIRNHETGIPDFDAAN